MTIKIDKNIPAPTTGAGAPPKYPFGEMEIGDSFFIANATGNALISASKNWRKNGEKYTSRTVTEDGVPGCRIWRIA